MFLMNNSNIFIKIFNFKKPYTFIHTSTAINKSQSGRYRITLKKNRRITYEMSKSPNEIAHKKSWNSWNTSNIVDGNRSMETTIEDLFIRKFFTGTWYSLFLSGIIIKRQHNTIRIAGIVRNTYDPIKYYFLIGYSEELLSHYLHCSIRLELQSGSFEETIHKSIQ